MTNIATHSLGTLNAPGATRAFPLRPFASRPSSPLVVVAQGSALDLTWRFEMSEDGVSWPHEGATNAASGPDIVQRVDLNNPRAFVRVVALDGGEVNMSFTLEA